jgi:hypothetical protein
MLKELSGVLEIESNSEGTLLTIPMSSAEAAGESAVRADTSPILPSSEFPCAFPAD